MMKKYISVIIVLLSISWGCNDDDYLNREPTNFLTEEQVYSNKDLTYSVLSHLYESYPDLYNFYYFMNQCDFDEAFPSDNFEVWRQRNQTYSYGYWSYWDYSLLREMNLFIKNVSSADKLEVSDRERFLAEGRFLRAAVYFELVKRMGGVPLITEPLEYNYSGDPTYLQYPRSKESEIYDFIINEMDAIKTVLPDDPSIKSRATKAAALAMKSRAALYAGSIARYGVNTPSVSTPGGEVGIPSSEADGYYTIALNAAQEIIGSGLYSLYLRFPDDLSTNFSSLFYDKTNNPEVIFMKDFLLGSLVHRFTEQNQPFSLTEQPNMGGLLNPTLTLVQSFELLDNTFAPLVAESEGDYVYYDHPMDIFAGRDARLAGTIILPGSLWKGEPVDIWAGYMLADGTIITGAEFGTQKVLPGNDYSEVVVGYDGPIDGMESATQTGFLLRKYLDPKFGSGNYSVQSDVPLIRFRYAEVLLNAAEAAYELAKNDLAVTYMNEVRSRAGFTTPLEEDDITFDRIVHERKVEFAFEGHSYYDLKRWRLSHLVFNGMAADLTTNPGKADEPSTQSFGLWPYRIHDPGNPNHGKYVFVKLIPNQSKNAHQFRLGNYYSAINNDILNNNPKIIRNPNH